MNMNKVLVSQRVSVDPVYNERRDAVDQNWCRFIMDCGYFPIFMPNSVKYVELILSEVEISGIVLTGGNDLHKYGGNVFERDEVEKYLLTYATENNIPLLGVCRGMQMIQDYFHIPLRKISGHINETISLNFVAHRFHELPIPTRIKVYHQWGTDYSVPELEVIAKSEDGIIMAIQHRKYPLLGIMWHPERQYPFSEFDKELFNKMMEQKLGLA